MRRLAALALGCALVLLAAGCSSPPAKFYTLSADAPPASMTSKLTIVVGPVAVPSVIDRPQIVVTSGANQVSVDEYSRWASPVQDNIARVVAENLVALLGTPRVTLFQSPLRLRALASRYSASTVNVSETPATQTALPPGERPRRRGEKNRRLVTV